MEVGAITRMKAVEEFDHKTIKYRIRDFLTCDSINITCMLTCPCDLRYICP